MDYLSDFPYFPECPSQADVVGKHHILDKPFAIRFSPKNKGYTFRSDSLSPQKVAIVA